MVEKQTKEPCKSDCGCRQSLCGRPAKNRPKKKQCCCCFFGGAFRTEAEDAATQYTNPWYSQIHELTCVMLPSQKRMFEFTVGKKKNMIRVAFWPSFSRKPARLGSLSKIFGGFLFGIWQSKNENLPNSKIHQNQNCTMYINNAGWHLSCSWKSHLSERARTFPSFFWEGLKLVLPLKWDKTVGSYPIDRDEQWAC